MNAVNPKDRTQLEFAMTLSLFFGLLMFLIKAGAFWLTGSTAILSDAAESVVHVAAVSFAAYSLRLSYKPADDSHLFGHAKVSFFSAGFEGAMIVIAAIYIVYTAIRKWLGGLQLEHLDFGTGLTALAAAINGALGWYLLTTGRRKHSIILEANGKHVLTDSWTSLGVLVGLALTWTTGWLPWDPIFAILTALNILYSGAHLIAQSVGGLMDRAHREVGDKLKLILDQETGRHGLDYHGLRYRDMGNRQAVEVHLLFPGDISIRDGHRKATEIERVIETAFTPEAYVTTHLESIEDHAEMHPGGQH